MSNGSPLLSIAAIQKYVLALLAKPTYKNVLIPEVAPVPALWITSCAGFWAFKALPVNDALDVNGILTIGSPPLADPLLAVTTTRQLNVTVLPTFV